MTMQDKILTVCKQCGETFWLESDSEKHWMKCRMTNEPTLIPYVPKETLYCSEVETEYFEKERDKWKSKYEVLRKALGDIQKLPMKSTWATIIGITEQALQSTECENR